MTTEKAESGIDREGVRPNSGLTNQQQEPRLTRGVPLPPAIDRGTLVTALAFLVMHHESGRDQARRDAGDEKFTAFHHQEQIYQIGEQIALLGGRNGWPRPGAANV